MNKKLSYFASLIVFYEITRDARNLNVKDIVSILDKLMESGVYYYSFEYLRPPIHQNNAMINPYFKRVLHDLNVYIPQCYEDALHGIMRFHLSAIQEGKINPIHGMLTLREDLSWSSSSIPGIELQPITAYIIDHLVFHSYSYDSDEWDLSDLEEDIKQTAQKWMNCFPD